MNLITVGAKAVKKSVVPAVWNKREVGTGDGALNDLANVVAWPAGAGLWQGATNTFADAPCSGGSMRFATANNQHIFFRPPSNCTGFRVWCCYSGGASSGNMGTTIDSDVGGFPGSNEVITGMSGTYSTPTKVYEVTGLAPAQHMIRVRMVGSGMMPIDYLEWLG